MKLFFSILILFVCATVRAANPSYENFDKGQFTNSGTAPIQIVHVRSGAILTNIVDANGNAYTTNIGTITAVTNTDGTITNTAVLTATGRSTNLVNTNIVATRAYVDDVSNRVNGAFVLVTNGTSTNLIHNGTNALNSAILTGIGSNAILGISTNNATNGNFATLLSSNATLTLSGANTLSGSLTGTGSASESGLSNLVTTNLFLGGPANITNSMQGGAYGSNASIIFVGSNSYGNLTNTGGVLTSNIVASSGTNITVNATKWQQFVTNGALIVGHNTNTNYIAVIYEGPSVVFTNTAPPGTNPGGYSNNIIPLNAVQTGANTNPVAAFGGNGTNNALSILPSGIVLAPAGSAAAPAYSFRVATGTGIYGSTTANGVGVTANGTSVISIFNTQLGIASTIPFGWSGSSDTTGPLDARLSRIAPTTIGTGALVATNGITFPTRTNTYATTNAMSGTASVTNLSVIDGTNGGNFFITNVVISGALGSGLLTNVIVLTNITEGKEITVNIFATNTTIAWFTNVQGANNSNGPYWPSNITFVIPTNGVSRYKFTAVGTNVYGFPYGTNYIGKPF